MAAKKLVTEAMEDGALGLSSLLIYAPAFHAETDKLTALSAEAAKFGSMYISHIRSEGRVSTPARLRVGWCGDRDGRAAKAA